jgi:transposase-like protein
MKKERIVHCPYCKNDDQTMIEILSEHRFFCLVCSKTFLVGDNDDSKDSSNDSH